jgi:hypothetical protein
VRLSWADVAGPLAAKILFRIGEHDGLTLRPARAVAHALRDIEGPGWETSSDRLFTGVRAVGERAEVLALLERACAALGEDAPAAPRPATLLGEHLRARFELAPPTDGDGWFTRGNAAVWMSGEPPDGFALPLPDGPRKPVAPARLRADGEPPRRGDFAVITGLAEWSPALGVTTAILQARLDAALPRYAPEAIATLVDGRLGHVLLACPCAPRAGSHVLARLQTALDAPPRPHELDDRRALAPEGLARLEHEAECALLGRAPDSVADYEAVDADAVARVLEALHSSAWV